MKLAVAGHPLHTRSLTVTIREDESEAYAIDAAVLDLRKCGFIPVAGFLQPAGIVHHMTLDASLDPATRVFKTFSGAQPTKAFAPSKLTAGECCSDPLPLLGELAGVPLDDCFARALGRVFGGRRGCSHLVTLAQLLAPSVMTSLEWNEARCQDGHRRRPGDRIFHRAVDVDGYELENGQVQLAIQLTDIHFVGAPEVAIPMDHFGSETEVRVNATVDLSDGMSITHISGAQRTRDYDGLEAAEFAACTDELEFLNGQSAIRGISQRVLGEFGEASASRPLRDALLMLAPAFVQCLASLSDRWPIEAKANPSLLGICGRADSCYMWRDGGPVAIAGQEWDITSREDS
ncbi:MAG: hypothetical protein ACI8W3_002748 [Myxococcota bacterium]|jgi:hypothetical protein